MPGAEPVGTSSPRRHVSTPRRSGQARTARRARSFGGKAAALRVQALGERVYAVRALRVGQPTVDADIAWAAELRQRLAESGSGGCWRR
jgi:hypothetical protein